MNQRPIKVLIACPGLDHVRRGFESFARSCFEALRGESALNLELVKGSGRRAAHERSIPTLQRDTRRAQLLSRATRRPPFAIEHLAFSLSLLPLIRARRPDIVYFSEWHVGRALALWRRASGQRFKLVLCNGTSHPGPYEHLDLVQMLTPATLEYVLHRGADSERTAVLPYGFNIPPNFERLPADDRRALRKRLGLPEDRRIVISVAALNYQKRIDYIVDEIASMPEPRPFLLVLGQVEEETPSLRTLAQSRLGGDGHSLRTVPREDVVSYLTASDIFVLASLWEGLPLALIEAMAQGLPCIAHTFPVMEYALGDQGHAADLDRPGTLGQLIAGIDDHELAATRSADRHRSVYERFSWDRLRPQYVDLFGTAVELPPLHG